MLTIFLRSVILYAASLLAMRAMGKRQVGQLQPFELVVVIMIAELAATPMGGGGIPILYGLLPMAALVVCHGLLTALCMKSERVRVWLCGQPTVLVRNGVICEKQLRAWGREPFWAYYSELQYRHVDKKLLIEEYIGTPDGTLPEDYKFYCFHGRADCVMLCVGRDEGWPKFYFFDRDFRLLRINRDSQAAPEDFTLPKPAGLDEALAIADRLSKPFDFVRVDLYLTPRGVRFGELTFPPAAALDNKRLPETDLRFGRRMEETL